MASQPIPGDSNGPPRPPSSKGLIRPYYGKTMVNKPLIRPEILVGYVRG